MQKAYIMHADSKTGGQIQGLPLFDWREVPRMAAEGWERLPALDGTHHGEYSALMRRVEHGAATSTLEAIADALDTGSAA